MATQLEIAALEKAISQGVTSVSVGDRRIQYRSLDEMIRTLTFLKNQSVQTQTATFKTSNVIYNSGL